MVHPFIEKRRDPLGHLFGLADEEVVRRERRHLGIEFGRSLGTVAGA